jgi:uncharacterized protein YcbX
MLGEELPQLELVDRGVQDDRLWSVRTTAGKIGSGKNSRRFAAVMGLLDLRASTHDGGVRVQLPDGRCLEAEDADTAGELSRFLGRPVTLARETDVMHFDDGPVSLIGTASVAALSGVVGADVDITRFRPNVVLATAAPYAEDSWVGREVSLGSAVLRVTMTSPRCVMVNMATADLPEQPGNLVALGRLHDACLGVIAEVVQPGVVSLGDTAAVR